MLGHKRPVDIVLRNLLLLNARGKERGDGDHANAKNKDGNDELNQTEGASVHRFMDSARPV